MSNFLTDRNLHSPRLFDLFVTSAA